MAERQSSLAGGAHTGTAVGARWAGLGPWLGLGLLLGIASAAAHEPSTVAVYRCELPDGTIAFQDRPCNDGDGRRMEVAAEEGEGATTRERIEAINERFDAYLSDLRQRRQERREAAQRQLAAAPREPYPRYEPRGYPVFGHHGFNPRRFHGPGGRHGPGRNGPGRNGKNRDEDMPQPPRRARDRSPSHPPLPPIMDLPGR